MVSKEAGRTNGSGGHTFVRTEDEDGLDYKGWQPIWYRIGPVEFAAEGDILLVIEDEFRSGYECRTCNGTGTASCTECQGKGSYEREGLKFKCSECDGKGEYKCRDCGGKGALLVVPDQSVRRPTTGRGVSVGPGKLNEHGTLMPMIYKVGDDVLY